MYASWATQATGTVEWVSFNGAAWTTPGQIPHSETLVNPGLTGYHGSLYDAWTPNIEGSPIDYSVRS
jgi:hypothetical protein